MYKKTLNSGSKMKKKNVNENRLLIVFILKAKVLNWASLGKIRSNWRWRMWQGLAQELVFPQNYEPPGVAKTRSKYKTRGQIYWGGASLQLQAFPSIWSALRVIIWATVALGPQMGDQSVLRMGDLILFGVLCRSYCWDLSQHDNQEA